MTHSDTAEIRRILQKDPRWSLYALGDLAPEHAPFSEWRSRDSGTGLILLYRAVTPPVLLPIGAPEAVAPLVAEVHDPQVYMHMQPEIVDAIAPYYRVVKQRPMWRMVLDPARFRPAPCLGCERLGESDLPALARLYEDGHETGEAPDFFFPSMVTGGVFYGAREEEELAAVAGTHLAVPAEGVAAVGNVYTRRDRRRRGLAAALTSAVTAELLRIGIATIGMNVLQSNEAAVRVYERLGFYRYCAFVEGIAERV